MIEMEIARFGGPGVFRRIDRPSPPLASGCVRIRVTASGINFAEVQMRMGLYPEAPRPPFVPGFEVAGVVAETAPDVRDLAPGDRVLAACRFGGYATEVAVPAWQVRRAPPNLGDVEAAAVPVAFLTAWIIAHEMARVRPHDRVLVVGAAGGVGTAVVQLAARAGAAVTGLVGSAAKRGPVLALGAREALTYEAWGGRPRDRCWDVVLESRGGAALKDSMRRLAPGGRVVSYGVSSIVGGSRRSVVRALGTILGMPLVHPLGLVFRNIGIFGANLLALWDAEDGRAVLSRAMDGVLAGFSRGELRAVVDRTFPLAEAGAAHQYLQSRASVGKVVLISGG